MDLMGDSAQVAVTFEAGSSQLTLTISAMDPQKRGGTATLSGVWKGVAVQWTGFADLTSNPFVTRPISGWPAGAFASELNQAGIFAPLGTLLGKGKGGPIPVTTRNGVPLHVLITEDGSTDRGDAGRAVAWCVGGAFAGAWGGPAGAAAGCPGGHVRVSWFRLLVIGTPGTAEHRHPEPGQGSQSPLPPGSDGGVPPPPSPDDPPSGPVSFPGDA